MPLEMADIILV